MKKKNIDAIDRRILASLQRDSSRSLAEIAASAGLSQTPCWTRIRRLESEGFIEGKVAILNREKLGVGVTVFVMVRTANHNEEWLGAFAKGVKSMPEVVEFYRMSGDVDYLLKIVCADIADYDRIYRKLIAVMPLQDVSSSFAMEQIKSTTELPLGL